MHHCCGNDIDAELVRKGIKLTESFYERLFNVNIFKALDPLDDEDFLKIVKRIGKELSDATAETEREALVRALEELDVDWPNLSETARERVFLAAGTALNSLPTRGMLADTSTVFGNRAEEVVEMTKRSVVRKFNLNIPVSFTDQDVKIIRYVAGSQSNFITDEYGRRAAQYDKQARAIVAKGIGKGLGREDIAKDLRAALGPAKKMGKARNYWDVIASSFVQNGRQWSQISTFQEGGIDRYRFQAVLDERTTDVCNMLHDRVFSVASAARTMNDVMDADPEGIKKLSPWVRNGKDENGNRILYTKDPDTGRRRLVARVEQTALGQRDKRGVFTDQMTNQQLESAGIPIPPLHGLCRSTIIAEL